MSGEGAIKGFDFHCHIDLHPDPVAFIAHCQQKRLAVIAVTTTPRAWPQNRIWCQNSAYVHAAVGLHPELVAERYAEIDLLEKYIEQSRLVGEVGLDGSPQYRKSYEQQKEVFERVLAASQNQSGRIVSIHSRRAARDTITLIRDHASADKVICILHWFSGSVAEAVRAADIGCLFSINPAMLDTDRGRALIRTLPRERILVETDSPFTRAGHNKSVPVDTSSMIERLATILSEKPTFVWDMIESNSRRTFGFAGIRFNSVVY